MAAVIRYNNRLSSNSGAVRCSYDNSGTAPDVPVHLATMLCVAFELALLLLSKATGPPYLHLSRIRLEGPMFLDV